MNAITIKDTKKILIIDDDQKIAMALDLRLKAAGYQTALAYDAISGVNSAIKLQPDLVLLDISMPAGDGFTVAQRIQNLVPVSTPIIFLTASRQQNLKEKALSLGAVGYIEKPYESGALLAEIKNALGGF